MSPLPPAKRGMYFEEFAAGQKINTASRTITETDIVMFAGLSGDFNQIHVDAEYSKTTPFGQRVAHGLLGLSIASGLVVQTGMMEGTIMAFREVNEWKFIKPIYIGDTIHVKKRVTEKQEKSLQRGLITFDTKVFNQDNEAVLVYQDKLLIQRKTA